MHGIIFSLVSFCSKFLKVLALHTNTNTNTHTETHTHTHTDTYINTQNGIPQAVFVVSFIRVALRCGFYDRQCMRKVTVTKLRECVRGWRRERYPGKGIGIGRGTKKSTVEQLFKVRS